MAKRGTGQGPMYNKNIFHTCCSSHIIRFITKADIFRAPPMTYSVPTGPLTGWIRPWRRGRGVFLPQMNDSFLNMASIGDFDPLNASIPATKVEITVSCR
ncbi:hypothetical protein EYF80_034614 [Liparis tanakae]|uniref:Uncharacterized protein n=1 Tax=Liparis tanakae TaxID=230148 RepID=A0A4Z2GP91_9TELE|nr:hypothetical protein EYF80_034614 [Liparis tanakae]